ncbi:MAG TPA: hypothetical protein VKA64_11590 [Gammaproteobacteria bacterium]|nr:hypothetical protein [Gammaproteobacteria bacterium]
MSADGDDRDPPDPAATYVRVLGTGGRWRTRRLRSEGAIAVFGLDGEPPLVLTEAVDLKPLRQAMQEAHPDRGGTAAQFRRARAAYEKARRKNRDDGD